MGIEAVGLGEGASGPMRAWATLLTQIEKELIVALAGSGSGPAQVNESAKLNQSVKPAETGLPSQPADSAPSPSGGLTQIARQLPLLLQTAQVGAAMELATSSLRSAVEILTAVLATLDELPAAPTPQQLQVAQQTVRAAVARLPLLPVLVDEGAAPAPIVPVELPPSIRQLLGELLSESSPTQSPLPTPGTSTGEEATPEPDLPPTQRPNPTLPATAHASSGVNVQAARLQSLAQSLARLQVLDSLHPGPFTADRALTNATLDAVRAALDHTGTWQREVTDGFRALGLTNETLSLDTVRAAVADLQRNPGTLVQAMLTARFDVPAATVLMLLQGALGATAPHQYEDHTDVDAIERERCDDCVYWSLCRFTCWRQQNDPEARR